jgi:hypothetical protein
MFFPPILKGEADCLAVLAALDWAMTMPSKAARPRQLTHFPPSTTASDRSFQNTVFRLNPFELIGRIGDRREVRLGPDSD